MSEWKRVRLGDVGRVVTGSTPPTKKPECYGGNYLFVTPSDLGYDTWNVLRTERTISDVGYHKYCSRCVPKGAIMYTCIASIGKIGVARSTVLTNQQINSLIPNEGNDGRFIYHLLRFNTERIRGLNAGCAVPIINKTDFENIEVDVPPLPLQRRIADILSAYDDLIENNRRRIAILEETARTLYKEMVRSESAFSEITLLDVFDFTRGVSYTSKEIESEDGTLLVNLKNIQAWGGYRVGMEKRFSGVYKQAQTLSAGDVIMGVTDMTQDRRLVGHVALVPTLEGETTFSADIIKLHPKALSNIVLYCLLRFSGVCERIAKLATGATVLHLRPKELSSIKMQMPQMQSICRFEENVDGIFQQIDLLNRQNANLAAARDLLLPRLMSGRLRVDAAAGQGKLCEEVA